MIRAARDLHDAVALQFSFADADDVRGCEHDGIASAVGTAGASLAVVIKTPAPDGAFGVYCEGRVGSGPDDCRFSSSGTEDDFLGRGAIDSTSLWDFTPELANFSRAAGVDITV